MRLIWTTPDEKKAQNFAQVLSKSSIDNELESQEDRDWGKESFGTKLYRIWVRDEDKTDESKALLEKFIHSPESCLKAAIKSDTHTDSTSDAQNSPPHPQFVRAPHFIRSPTELFLRAKLKSNLEARGNIKQKSPLTRLLTFICCLLFLSGVWTIPEESTLDSSSNRISYTTTPLRSLFLFDYPKQQELFDSIAQQYGEKALSQPKTLPEAALKIYNQAIETPAWTGIWDILLLKYEKQPIPKEGPLFEKIKQGEVWRLITPTLLHADFLHLFFNMVWLIILAPQIEVRIGTGKFLVLTLLIAALSNTVQYLVSGPAFIGFSGVICGYAAFIWTRIKTRPWEGYTVQPGTFSFLLFFVGLLSFLSIGSFFLEAFFNTQFPIGVANSAHISGGLLGLLFGKLDYFRSQQEDEHQQN